MISFPLAYLCFGPIVAIPVGLTLGMPWMEMLFQGLSTQLMALTVVHFILQALEYPRLHKRALIEKFALVTNHKIKDVRQNTEKISSLFYEEFGHFGYYLSLIVLAFLLGVVWASIIAFALRLRFFISSLFIAIGAIIAFGFWFWVINESLNYIAVEASFVLAVVLSFMLLFYGEVREKHILKRLKKRLKR